MNAYLIAEFKRQSPFGGVSYPDARVEDIVPLYESWGANAISVLFSAEWGGSVEDIARARAVTDLPILAKGLVRSADELPELADAGANQVLLIVGRNEECVPAAKAAGLKPYVEARTFAELERAGELAHHVVINARDLRDSSIDRGVHERLLSAVPSRCYAVAASGFDVGEEPPEGYAGVLVGGALMERAATALGLAARDS